MTDPNLIQNRMQMYSQRGDLKKLLDTAAKILASPLAGQTDLAADLRASSPSSGKIRTDLVGSLAPDFSLQNLEGQTVKLSDFNGKILLLALRSRFYQGDEARAEEQWSKTGFLKESSWFILGPSDNIEGIGFQKAYIPEDTKKIDLMAQHDGKRGKIRWEKRQDKNPDGFVDLDAIFGGELDWVTAYAWTTVYSPEERQALIRFGSDDQAKVWLAGEQVFTFAQGRAPAIDQDIVPVKLRAGENQILVKVCDMQSGWGFSISALPIQRASLSRI